MIKIPPPTWAAVFCILQIVISVKLGGVRNLGKLGAFSTLVLDEIDKQLLGEDTARGQIVVVGLKRIQRLGKGGGQTLELLLFFFGQVEQIEVGGVCECSRLHSLAYPALLVKNPDISDSLSMI